MFSIRVRRLAFKTRNAGCCSRVATRLRPSFGAFEACIHWQEMQTQQINSIATDCARHRLQMTDCCFFRSKMTEAIEQTKTEIEFLSVQFLRGFENRSCQQSAIPCGTRLANCSLFAEFDHCRACKSNARDLGCPSFCERCNESARYRKLSPIIESGDFFSLTVMRRFALNFFNQNESFNDRFYKRQFAGRFILHYDIVVAEVHRTKDKWFRFFYIGPI